MAKNKYRVCFTGQKHYLDTNEITEAIMETLGRLDTLCAAKAFCETYGKDAEVFQPLKKSRKMKHRWKKSYKYITYDGTMYIQKENAK